MMWDIHIIMQHKFVFPENLIAHKEFSISSEVVFFCVSPTSFSYGVTLTFFGGGGRGVNMSTLVYLLGAFVLS